MSTESLGATVCIKAAEKLHPVSRYLTGVCLEDVNHEVYGGLYSQMVYGESFQEPIRVPPPEGFEAHGGSWRVGADGVLTIPQSNGDYILSRQALPVDGEVSVKIWFDDDFPGNCALLLDARSDESSYRLQGDEVALVPNKNLVALGRFRNGYEQLAEATGTLPFKTWVELNVKRTADETTVSLQGVPVLTYREIDSGRRSSGTFGFRSLQQTANVKELRYREADGPWRTVPLPPSPQTRREVSYRWEAVERGTAHGVWRLEAKPVWNGNQSQSMEFTDGQGEVVLTNAGLNGRGMDWIGGKNYEGRVVVWSERPVRLTAALESADGSRVDAEQELALRGDGWQTVNFELTPSATTTDGRLAFKLRRPGKVVFGYAELQPGAWGRFHGLPVRRDVAELLLKQGVTVLRYGGSMINSREYRWKKMIGPREGRPAYSCIWYSYSSNGWGIIDFLNLCEALQVPAIPALNMGETPEDLADFVEYVNGGLDTVWGRRRAADGHPEPYRLRQLELGNEERVDDAYFQCFKPLAETVWAKDPDMILTVGDFVYDAPIDDPAHVTGAMSKITNLDGQRKILELARQHGREIRFDIHLATTEPHSPSVLAYPSFLRALEAMAPGANMKLVVYELNADIHSMRRALGNAATLIEIINDGRVPVVCSANALQVDRHNDNHWDQGLLFMNNTSVWLQPPGYVMQMFSRYYRPWTAATEGRDVGELECCALCGDDGRTITWLAVNPGSAAMSLRLQAEGAAVTEAVGEVLAAELDAVNTAKQPETVAPQPIRFEPTGKSGEFCGAIPAHSVVALTLQ